MYHMRPDLPVRLVMGKVADLRPFLRSRIFIAAQGSAITHGTGVTLSPYLTRRERPLR